MRFVFYSLLALPLIACGGTPTAEPESGAPVTTGGEVPDEPDAAPVTLRTTTPVPVPQTPTPRDDLTEQLRELWTRTELVVNDRPPTPPEDATDETIQSWAQAELIPWVDGRRQAIEEAEPLLEPIQGLERGVAAALFGYMYEDSAAGVRGAPVPTQIAADAELLNVYDESLKEMLEPFAIRAVESYVFCVQTIAASEEAVWGEWAGYCFQRATDVADVFELQSPSSEEAAP